MEMVRGRMESQFHHLDILKRNKASSSLHTNWRGKNMLESDGMESIPHSIQFYLIQTMKFNSISSHFINPNSKRSLRKSLYKQLMTSSLSGFRLFV